jgi:hypothetical protein
MNIVHSVDGTDGNIINQLVKNVTTPNSNGEVLQKIQRVFVIARLAVI